MDLHPEESSNILNLVYSKARLNGKILKPPPGRKCWEKYTEQDIAIWTDVPGPFQPELQVPPTLACLFSNRVHSKIPPSVHWNGHIPLNCCLDFLGSPWATETDTEINFVTRESISFHFPERNSMKINLPTENFDSWQKAFFWWGIASTQTYLSSHGYTKSHISFPRALRGILCEGKLGGPWGGGKVASIIMARIFNYQEFRLLWSHPKTGARCLGAVSDGPAETTLAVEAVLSPEEMGLQDLTSFQTSKDLPFPDRCK